MKKCISYCACEKFDFKSLVNYFEEKHKVIKYKDVLLIQDRIGLCFIFDYGALVFFGHEHDYVKKTLDETSKFQINSYNELITEEFYFDEGNVERTKILNDVISLVGDSVEEKIAVSHGIAQSTKLNFFEKTVENTIELTKSIPLSLKETGNIKLSKKEISKMRGELFLTKSSINLDYELLDEPEFFWEYPELSNFYKIISNYLEIKTRTEILNKKLEVIHELFQMLSDEQNHKHSSILEWIIIWLIVIEIIFTILHDIFKLF